MIHLSRLLLNPRCRQVQAELHNPYQMHRTICKAFGDRDGELAAARCLFRVDLSSDHPEPALLVQSLLRPDWTRLTVGSDYLAAPPESKTFLPAFRPGQRLRFRLRANPTKRLPAGDREAEADGPRVGVYGDEAQRRWLDRKGELGGFKVLACRITDRGLQTSRERASGQPIRHLCVDFEGVLEVTDRDRFFAVLASGVGSAKGFGYGLLSVARV